ncbi:helix-turn-helix domain-containing protein [Nocardia tengchongensis]|uniref:helix-turn-helix domain-containing protein n=1 Tax=Nocardia tengchongensis TaxID=2055889 RepID=UPI0036A8CAEA
MSSASNPPDIETRARTFHLPRKPALTAEQAGQLGERAAAGESKSLLAKEFGISRETVYSHLRTEAINR